MKDLAIAVVMAAVIVYMSGCSATPYAELGMGYNGSFFGADWDNGGHNLTGATIEVGGEWEFEEDPTWSGKCRYLHLSHWTVGPPWNDKYESGVDHVGCAVRKEFR